MARFEFATSDVHVEAPRHEQAPPQGVDQHSMWLIVRWCAVRESSDQQHEHPATALIVSGRWPSVNGDSDLQRVAQRNAPESLVGKRSIRMQLISQDHVLDPLKVFPERESISVPQYSASERSRFTVNPGAASHEWLLPRAPIETDVGAEQCQISGAYEPAPCKT